MRVRDTLVSSGETAHPAVTSPSRVGRGTASCRLQVLFQKELLTLTSSAQVSQDGSMGLTGLV